MGDRRGKRVLLTQATAYMGPITARVFAGDVASTDATRVYVPTAAAPFSGTGKGSPACGRSAVRTLRLRHVQPEARRVLLAFGPGPAPAD